MEVLTNATVEVISQYISLSNQHIVHLKFTYYYMSIISLKLKNLNLKFTSSIPVATFLVFLWLVADIWDITNTEYFHQCRKFY